MITDAQGIPLAARVTAANTHDVTQMLPLVDSIPKVSGQPGPPRQRPDRLQGDAAYRSFLHRRQLWQRGIKPLISQHQNEHGSGLGKTRWVVERTVSWLKQFRRLRVRYDRDDNLHQAFLTLACSLICWRFVT